MTFFFVFILILAHPQLFNELYPQELQRIARPRLEALRALAAVERDAS